MFDMPPLSAEPPIQFPEILERFQLQVKSSQFHNSMCQQRALLVAEELKLLEGGAVLV
jgi:hypothetical protein